MFARDCAAPSVREQSVLFTLLAVRDFLALELVPALAVFFRGEYQVRRSGPG